jgi:cell wall-associated NlpC family hydrolase
MEFKKTIHYLLIVFIVSTSFGYSQIITSKKEAEKKGIYQKPVDNRVIKEVVTTDTKKRVTETAVVKPAVSEDNKNIDVAVEIPNATKVVTDNKIKETKTSKIVKPLAKPKKVVINDKEDDDLVTTPEENYLALQLINNAMSFVGVKYHGGGTSTSGMDCSGMVTAVFNVFDLKLPRSSHEMAKVGEKRDPKCAQKGDLIFFKTRGRGVISHVGMVVDVLQDEIKFIHSATSGGVKISSTKEPYYKRTFVQVNKVLDK